jgi:hypothetical protein
MSLPRTGHGQETSNPSTVLQAGTRAPDFRLRSTPDQANYGAFPPFRRSIHPIAVQWVDAERVVRAGWARRTW